MTDINRLLNEARTIAVVGISNKPHRDSYRVSHYMQQAGYRIIPVNPVLKGQEVLGETVVESLKDIQAPIDIVNVFRRAELVGPVVDEAIAVGARAVWIQLGIVNEAAAQKAREAGLEVVMDRCIMVDHAGQHP
jgi:uncharacterized protein